MTGAPLFCRSAGTARPRPVGAAERRSDEVSAVSDAQRWAPAGAAKRELCRAAPATAATPVVRSSYHAGRLRSPTRFMTQSSRRLLDVDIPAQPDVLVQLSLLLAEDEVDLNAASLLISSDMALAAAVLKAVNSAMYGLRGRVQSVQQAITYLGTREVASVTFEMGLRAVFPPAPELEPVWERAARARPADGPASARRSASTPGPRIRPACSRNAARRCMFRHATERYRPMLRAGRERRGAADARARAASASATTRSAPRCARAGAWRRRRSTACAITSSSTARSSCRCTCSGARSARSSAMAHALMTDPDTLDDVARKVAPQAELDPLLALRGARRVQEQIEMAVERARPTSPSGRRSARSDSPSWRGPGAELACGYGSPLRARRRPPWRTRRPATRVAPEQLALQRLYHWEKTAPDRVDPDPAAWAAARCATSPGARRSTRSRRMAAHLQSARASRPATGSRILSKNCAHWLMADFAIWMAGHVSVPLYPTLAADTIRQILEHSESKLLFVGKLDGWDGDEARRAGRAAVHRACRSRRRTSYPQLGRHRRAHARRWRASRCATATSSRPSCTPRAPPARPRA